MAKTRGGLSQGGGSEGRGRLSQGGGSEGRGGGRGRGRGRGRRKTVVQTRSTARTEKSRGDEDKTTVVADGEGRGTPPRNEAIGGTATVGEESRPSYDSTTEVANEAMGRDEVIVATAVESTHPSGDIMTEKTPNEGTGGEKEPANGREELVGDESARVSDERLTTKVANEATEEEEELIDDDGSLRDKNSEHERQKDSHEMWMEESDLDDVDFIVDEESNDAGGSKKRKGVAQKTKKGKKKRKTKSAKVKAKQKVEDDDDVRMQRVCRKKRVEMRKICWKGFNMK